MKVRVKHVGSARWGKVGMVVEPEGQTSRYSIILTLPQEYQAVKCQCCNGYHYPSLDGLKFPKFNSLITISDSVELTPLGE
jgi:hypothetical protein